MVLSLWGTRHAPDPAGLPIDRGQRVGVQNQSAELWNRVRGFGSIVPRLEGDDVAAEGR